MAITFVNAGAKGASNGADITLGAPASPLSGDVWIATLFNDADDRPVFTDWTFIAEASSSINSNVSAWYFRYAGSAPNLVASVSGANAFIGGILAFRGCVASGNPVNTIGAESGGTDASIEILGITPSVSDCMLLAIDGSVDDLARSPIPSGFAAGFEDVLAGTQNCYVSNLGDDSSVAGHYKIHTSGPTGDFTDTMPSGDRWESFLIALAPEVAGGGQPTMRRYGGIPHGQHGQFSKQGRGWGYSPRHNLMLPRRLMGV